jgi:hypothetical protein
VRDDGKIEVLEPNRNAVLVYMDCSWDIAASMAGIFFYGISAREIESACNLLGIPPSERADIPRRVRIMVDAVRPLRNRHLKRSK